MGLGVGYHSAWPQGIYGEGLSGSCGVDPHNSELGRLDEAKA